MDLRFNKGDKVTLLIEGLGHSGEGVGRLNGLTIFIEGALPGEKVIARLEVVKKTHAFGKLITIITSSNERIPPPCPIFETCGGCQIMHLCYEKQLAFKKQKVMDAVHRIGKIDPSIVLDPIPSPKQFEYRNKIQLPVRDLGKPTLGLYGKSSHNLVPLDKCLIHCSLGEEVFQTLKDLTAASDITPYDPKTGKGELRHVLIKSAIATVESLVILVTKKKASTSLKKLASSIFQKIPQVKGVIHNIHSGTENVILGNEFIPLEGSSTIQETLLDLSFKISGASFFQVNPLQAENLYLKALEFADVDSSTTVLDAYCGVGTLSLVFAKKAKHVTGVESVPQAIEDAKENAKQNDIQNVSFFAKKAEIFIQNADPVDVLLVNPPRKGCDKEFLHGIPKLKPKKIVYISCDPATLSRDLSILEELGYKTKQIQPLDMFPQTSHVECVAEILPK